MKAKNFINIDQIIDLEIFEQLEDENSPVNEYLSELYINLAVNNLKDDDVAPFVNLVNTDQDNQAREYLLNKIPDFDKKLNLAVMNNLQKLRGYII